MGCGYCATANGTVAQQLVTAHAADGKSRCEGTSLFTYCIQITPVVSLSLFRRFPHLLFYLAYRTNAAVDDRSVHLRHTSSGI